MVIRPRRSILESLLSSRVRVRLLTIFLLSPDAAFHARALMRQVGAQYNAVWKELQKLEQIGLLTSESAPNVRTFRVNPRFPILPELRSILLKTVGAGVHIRNALQETPVQAAFVYGSFAAGNEDQHSDIDLMLIGRIDLARLAPTIARLEKDLERSVNYVAFTSEEWREKARRREPFVENVLASPKIMLIGEEDALRATHRTGTHPGLQGTSSGNPKSSSGRRPRPHPGGAESAR